MKTKQILAFGCILFFVTNLSAQWIKQNTPAMNGLNKLQSVGKNVLWTANASRSNLGWPSSGHVAQFIRTANGGQTYKLGQLSNIDYYFIEPYDAKTAYFLGGSFSEPTFLFRRTVDSGATWQNMPFTPPTFPALVHFYDANNGIYLGDPDSLGYYAAYTTNGGSTFTRIPQTNLPRPTETEYNWGGDYQILGDNIFMAVVDYTTGAWRMMRSIDRGRNWTSGEWFNIEFDGFELRFAFTDANNGMALSGIGKGSQKSLYTTDGGATWHESGKMPGLNSYPIDNVPNTSNLMAFFQDTVNRVLFTALTNDLGKTWNTRKDIGPYQLDSRFTNFGFAPFINGQLEIVDNNTAWAEFTNFAIHRYDSPTPIVPEKPDLELEFTTNNEGLPLYNSIKYTLTVRNRGISPATGVQINWLPPYKRTNNSDAPYAYQAAYADKGRYDSWNGVWTLDRIEAGGTATATFFLYVVNNKLHVTQTAQVVACNESDIDSSPNNLGAIPSEDDEISFRALSPVSGVEMPNLVAKRKADNFSVSPNPAKDKITLSLNAETDAPWTIRVINSLGQTVYIRQGQNMQSVDIDAKRFDAGLYLVEYQSNGERKVEKIMIER